MAITFRDLANPDFSNANNLMSSASRSIAKVTETFGRMEKERQVRLQAERQRAEQIQANQVLGRIAAAKNADDVAKAYSDLSGTGSFGTKLFDSGQTKIQNMHANTVDNQKMQETANHNRATEAINKRQNEITLENNKLTNATSKYGYDTRKEASAASDAANIERAKINADASKYGARIRANATTSAAKMRASATRAAGRSGSGSVPFGQIINRIEAFRQKYPNASNKELAAMSGVPIKQIGAVNNILNEGKPPKYTDESVKRGINTGISNSTFSAKDKLTIQDTTLNMAQQAANGELTIKRPDGTVVTVTPKQVTAAANHIAAGLTGDSGYFGMSGPVKAPVFAQKVQKYLGNSDSTNKNTTYHPRKRTRSRAKEVAKQLSGK